MLPNASGICLHKHGCLYVCMDPPLWFKQVSQGRAAAAAEVNTCATSKCWTRNWSIEVTVAIAVAVTQITFQIEFSGQNVINFSSRALAAALWHIEKICTSKGREMY